MDVRHAWGIWIALAVGICILSAATGFTRSVTGAYTAGADRWLASADLYGDGIHGFLYLPQAALLYLPFSEMPDAIGGVLWRLCSIALLAWGVFRISRHVGRRGNVEMFPIMTLVCILPSLAAMRNGQMTVPMTGCMLLAIASIADRRWWPAVAWLCFALAMKPLAIVLVLLALVLNPPLWWRFPAGLAVLLLLPYGFQSPAFVTETYRRFIEKLTVAGSPGASISYSDLFGILRVLEIETSEMIKNLVRVSAAFCTLMLSWISIRRFGKVDGTVMMGLLALLYILLFNPRTENNTYVAIAPVLASMAAGLFLVRHSVVPGWIIIAMTILIAANFELTKHITPGQETWLCPLLASALAGWIVILVIRGTCPWWPTSRDHHIPGS